jgi:hypothetical protein
MATPKELGYHDEGTAYRTAGGHFTKVFRDPKRPVDGYGWWCEGCRRWSRNNYDRLEWSRESTLPDADRHATDCRAVNNS